MFVTAIKNKADFFLQKHFDSETIPYKKVLSIFFPMMLDQGLIAIMNVINSSMVSASGAQAVAAVNMVDSLNFFFTNFFMAIGTGGTVVVAQYMGKDDHKNAGKATAQTVTSSTALAVVLAALLIIFSRQTIGVLFGNAEQAVLDNGITYLIGSLISYPVFAIYYAIIGALRGSGDSKVAMFVNVGMNALYVIGNIVFITVLKMGVFGLCVSLNVARLLGALAFVIYIFKFRPDLQMKVKDFFHIDKKMQKSILYIGIPSALEQVFFHGGKILTQTFIVSLGTMSMTANAIASSVVNLFYIPGNSINLTMVTIVGMCMGAKRVDEARKYTKLLIRSSILLTIIFIILLAPFTGIILDFYKTPDAAYMKTINIMLMCAIVHPIIWSQSFVLPSALRAAGDAKFATITSLLSMWLFRVIMGYVLGIVLKMDIEGVWLAMCLEWFVRGSVFMYRFKGDKWYKHNIIED